MVPRTLPEFLSRTGWEESNPSRLERMATALAYFLRVHQPISRLEENMTDKAVGSNCWSFKIDDRVTKLCTLMQCVCFDERVRETTLKAGTVLKKYTNFRTPGMVNPSGDWFTAVGQHQSGLAIKPDQIIPHHYTLKRGVDSLACVVADILVDWKMRVPKGKSPAVNVDYWYRKGGGVQFFVPDSALVLESIAAVDSSQTH